VLVTLAQEPGQIVFARAVTLGVVQFVTVIVCLTVSVQVGELVFDMACVILYVPADKNDWHMFALVPLAAGIAGILQL